jgi:phosphoribosylanthranilate isomerase
VGFDSAFFTSYAPPTGTGGTVVKRSTWIKMCGMTNARDVENAARAGANAVGFVFAESPRRVPAETVGKMAGEISPDVLRYGVFTDARAEAIEETVKRSGIDRIQWHGDGMPPLSEESGHRIVKAFRARDDTVLEEIREWAPDLFLLDSWVEGVAGGTGRTFDWSIAQAARGLGRLILAGGLTPENVGDAIRQVRPFGVDVSGGIESAPGIKDADRMRAFVEAVRAADKETDR